MYRAFSISILRFFTLNLLSSFSLATIASASASNVLRTGLPSLLVSSKLKLPWVSWIISKFGNGCISPTGIGISGLSLTSTGCISSTKPCSTALSNRFSSCSCILFCLNCASLCFKFSLPIPLRPAKLLTTRSAPAPITPPMVNSSAKLSPIGSSSLYKPLAIRSCERLANTSCAPSCVPCIKADLILSLSA